MELRSRDYSLAPALSAATTVYDAAVFQYVFGIYVVLQEVASFQKSLKVLYPRVSPTKFLESHLDAEIKTDEF